MGTCQLIESSPSDPGHQQIGPSLVTCLFTSDFFGRKKLTPQDIVANTRDAMVDLTQQLLQYDEGKLETKNGKIVLNMPKINAGLFGVPWEQTETILNQFNQFEINVYVL